MKGNISHILCETHKPRNVKNIQIITAINEILLMHKERTLFNSLL